MLSTEENELLTRVNPGTGGGALIRSYWIPALLSEELSTPDGAPKRLRLLGEDLVAFRDTHGRVGILEEACPHRQTSLALAFNGDCGLRCLYHGYKFDVEGNCLDAPTEPAHSNFQAKIRATAYPTREVQGVVWTYMGEREMLPPFPDFPWLRLPAEHSVAYKIFEECNWAQAVEGAVDSAHAGVLHRYQPWDDGDDTTTLAELTRDLAPHLEIEYTKYGFRYGALRHLDDETVQARVTAMAMPFWTVIPPTRSSAPGAPAPNRRLANAFVPRDDYSSWHFQFFFDATEAIDREYRREEGGIWLDEDYHKRLNLSNWYQQDRAMMTTGSFSGIRGILTQDHAVNESQGALMDRSREHLGSSDIAVIAWRRLVLRTIRSLVDDNIRPLGTTEDIPYEDITSETEYFHPSETWRDVVPLLPAFVLDPSGAL